MRTDKEEPARNDYEAMDQSHLVLSILLENESAYHQLSAQEIANFMASCKDAYNSKPLQTMRNKHRALYLYNKAWDTIQEAAFVLKTYRTIKDLDLSRKLFEEVKEFVKTFDNEPDAIKDCLSRLHIHHLHLEIYHLQSLQ